MYCTECEKKDSCHGCKLCEHFANDLKHICGKCINEKKCLFEEIKDKDLKEKMLKLIGVI